jgi:hypothetical protein
MTGKSRKPRSKTPAWKEFELLLAEIEQVAAPGATVKHNQKVMGKAGRERQLDIAVTTTIGLHRILIVIECRDYSRRITMEKVEAFVTKLQDVGANLGVMVSRNGFDAGAKAAARQHSIILRSYREAKNTDWEGIISNKTWLPLIRVSYKDVQGIIHFSDGTEEFVSDFLSQKLMAKDDEYIPVSLFFEDAMNIIFSEHKLGKFNCKFSSETVYQFEDKTGILKDVDEIEFFGEISAKEYVMNIKFGQGHIVEDELEQKPVFRRLVSEEVDWKSIIASQEGIEISEEQFQSYKAERHARWSNDAGQFFKFGITHINTDPTLSIKQDDIN